MKRYLFLFVTACALVMWIPAYAGMNPEKEGLHPRESGDPEIILDYLKNLTTFQATFTQRDDFGQTATGTFLLKRHKNFSSIKLDYDDPTPILILTRGDKMIFYDKELEQTNRITIEDTPIVLFSDPENVAQVLDIHSIDESADSVVLTAAVKEAADIANISAVFSKRENGRLVLDRWSVTDYENITTTVTLNNVVENQPISDKEFNFNDKRFFQNRTGPRR